MAGLDELLAEAHDLRRRVGDRLGLARSLLLLDAVLSRTARDDGATALIAEIMELDDGPPWPRA